MAGKEKLTQNGDALVHEIEDTETGQRMTVNLSFDQIMQLIKTAKEPDEDTLQAKAEEKRRRQESMANMLKEAQQEEASMKQRHDRCSHRKPDNASAVHGQIHSDGLIHPICVICQRLFSPYAAPRELMTGSGF